MVTSMEHVPRDARCRDLAATQHSVITRRQAASCGMSRSAVWRRVEAGAWTPILPGVYHLGVSRPAWATKAMAVVFWAGPGCALSHETAAVLWNLDGFAPGDLVVTTTRSLKPPADWVRVHRATLRPPDRSERGPCPVTSPARTLLDLAATHPVEEVEAALDDALRRRLVTLARMEWFVGSHASKGPPGTKALRRLLASRDAGPPFESPLEAKVWRLLGRSELPLPVRQHAIYESGRQIARIDFAYPAALVAIEVDGYRWHSGRQAWARDLARRNVLTGLGWRVIHVTHDDLVRSPDAIVDRVRTMLSPVSRYARRQGHDRTGDRG